MYFSLRIFFKYIILKVAYKSIELNSCSFTDSLQEITSLKSFKQFSYSFMKDFFVCLTQKGEYIPTRTFKWCHVLYYNLFLF